MTTSTPSGTILVIDDEAAVCAVLARLVERMGFTVCTLSDGPSALARVRAGVPDLRAVLVDLSMPQMSGDVLLEQLRPLLTNTALIMMSGYQPEQIAQRYTHLGVHAFLQKPFSRDVLYQTISDAIALAQSVNAGSV